MQKLFVPYSGITLYDGSIVMLERFPGRKWIVHYGWYRYLNDQQIGWYFCSIPDQSILPVTNEDLQGIIVLGDKGCRPEPPHPGCSIPFSPEMAYELDRAWLTVETIEQRDALNTRIIPNGKVIKVNDTGASNQPGYYYYDQSEQVWKEETFGIDKDSYLTKDEASTLYVNESEMQEFVAQSIQSNLEWKNIT